MADLEVPIRREAHALDLPLPAYATAGSAGMDLLAAIDAQAPLILLPLQRAVVPTGISIELPDGYEAQVRPRSGLAARNGVTVLNAPGTVDSDYRGEIAVILINLGESKMQIERGLRIAQLVIAPIVRCKWKENSTLRETPRGVGGFGSTGLACANGGRDG
ncbi:MAG TPA: dUTP diphosphatase [Geminicoccus sp.]|jgi:dUTP pyrophosphatase|uniref:dUTP diphosphatase n=1 Tax=Geminicoccus sp. TaxID=2024832 RepID=UPI002E35B9E9|nr:dUTP diphosphatase [Geminicoccus sp.]HEX2525127.1 dUTP diphosphatase [Geminicoccus sp.]